MPCTTDNTENSTARRSLLGRSRAAEHPETEERSRECGRFINHVKAEQGLSSSIVGASPAVRALTTFVDASMYDVALDAGNDLLQAAILGMQAVGFPFTDGCSVKDGMGSTVQQAAALYKDLERELLAMLQMTDEQAERREVLRGLDSLEGTSWLGADLAFLVATLINRNIHVQKSWIYICNIK